MTTKIEPFSITLYIAECPHRRIITQYGQFFCTECDKATDYKVLGDIVIYATDNGFFYKSVGEKMCEAPQQKPIPMSEPVITYHGQTLTMQEAKKQFDLGKIHKRFKQWAVTDYGLECITQYYQIEKERLSSENWVFHMMEKNWVDIPDFIDAYQAATVYFREEEIRKIAKN